MNSSQATLQTLWRCVPRGYLSPLEQLKALAWRDVLVENGQKLYGLYAKVAEQVVKVASTASYEASLLKHKSFHH